MFILAVLFSLPIMAQQPTTEIPTVKLEGTFGNDYTKGSVTIIQGTDTFTQSAKIKWRGGTTNTAEKHKRNYKIKFDDDVQLFGLRKDNNWILDAGTVDKFRLRNRIATELWNDFARKPYYYNEEPDVHTGVRGKVVKVYLNNEYRGIYSMTEAMDRKELKLKKFKGTTIKGQLWKADSWDMTMMYNVPTAYDNTKERWEGFELKYPEVDDLNPSDYSTLVDAINFVVTSNDDDFKAHIGEYFDLPVLEDYYIFLYITCAVDNRGKNMYWAVYDKTKSKKLTIAVWDLDGTMGAYWLKPLNKDFISPEYDMWIGINVLERMQKLDVDNFNEHITTRYNECRKTIFSEDSLTARYQHYYDLLHRNGLDTLEEKLWSGDTDINSQKMDFSDELQYIKDWIHRRLAYVDSKVFITTGIKSAITKDNNVGDNIYNLQGIKVSLPLKPGIYIKNNKKIIIR